MPAKKVKATPSNQKKDLKYAKDVMGGKKPNSFKKATPKVLKKVDAKKVVKPVAKPAKNVAKPAKSFGGADDRTGSMTGAPSPAERAKMGGGAKFEAARKKTFGLK